MSEGCVRAEDIQRHIGHDIEAVWYGEQTAPFTVYNVAIECVTCGEVIVDAEPVK